MLCTQKQNNSRDESEFKASFIVLARMGFHVNEIVVILGMKKEKVIYWLKTDSDFCQSIKHLPSFREAYGG